MEFTHAQIERYFYICLILGLGIGIYILYLGGRRAYRKIQARKSWYENVKTTTEMGHRVSFGVLWYMLPWVLMFILVNIPTFYFNAQLKKWDYCIELIKANKSLHIKKDDPDIINRCNCLNKEELFKEAAKN